MGNVSDFKSQLIGGGARANQFRAYLHFPTFVTAGALEGARAQFLCKSASLPGSTIASIEIPYRGRVLNVAGERTFQPWQVTIYNDVTFGLRNAFESWQAGIQRYAATEGKTNPAEYQVELEIHQLDRNGATLKIYKFADAFPTSIGAITLDYDSANQLETFDVEFTYNYFTSNTGTDTDGSSFGVNLSVDTPIGTLPFSL
jgi:hypothetical protein